jgi:hypothetical protein
VVTNSLGDAVESSATPEELHYFFQHPPRTALAKSIKFRFHYVNLRVNVHGRDWSGGMTESKRFNVVS